MTQDNPFLKFRARTILVWIIISSPIVILVSIYDDPIFLLTISNIWIYGVIFLWCWCQIKQSKINVRRLFGKLPRSRHSIRLLCLVIPVLMFSLGSGQILYYLLSFAFPDYIESSLRQKIFLSSVETSFPILYNSLTVVSLVIIAPISEEILFRGLLLQRWSYKWRVTTAVIISSLVFGVLHANLIGLSVFGLVMSLLYLKTRTLFLPIICHSLNNGVVVVVGLISLIFNSQETVYTLEQFRSSWWMGILYMGLSAPWLIFFVCQNWSNKRENLPYSANISNSL